MAIRDNPNFEENSKRLQYLLDLREPPRKEIDQKYLTKESIIDRIDALQKMNLLDGKRVLSIGDADLTALAIAIFGEPQEVVVADIDDRLSEIYFEATMEYDLPVRFVYHDMRIKMIAILKRQYSLVLCEPPQTASGVKQFLSRSLEILEPGDASRLVFSVPTSGDVREEFEKEIGSYEIEVGKIFPQINQYVDNTTPTDYIELIIPDDVEPKMKNHYVRPLYEDEVSEAVHRYRCVCRTTIEVGEGQQFATIESLEASGCPDCDYEGIFAYQSDIQLK